MRRRRQLSAFRTYGEENVNSGEQNTGTSRMEDTSEDLRTAAGEEEGIGAMLNLLVSYRNIITQMDRLLVEASLTAEHLGLASEHVDDSHSTDHHTRSATGALMRHAVSASENRRRGVGHAEPSAMDTDVFPPTPSQTTEHDLVELSHTDELALNVTLTQPQAPQSPCSIAQHFSISARDQPHRSVGRNIAVGNPSAVSGQMGEEETDANTQGRPLRMTSAGMAAIAATGRQPVERTVPLHLLSSVEMTPAFLSMPLTAVGARRPSSRNTLSVNQNSSDNVQANAAALQQRRGSSLQSPALSRITPDGRGSLMGTPGRRRPVPPALRRGSHVSLELPGSGVRRVSVQPRQGAVFSVTATASFPVDRRSSR